MSITLVGTPDNLRLPTHLKGARVVTGDVYDICKRIREVDPNLFVVAHDGHPEPFVVMEKCLDGEERVVSRYARLDASILEDLQRMLKIPWMDRFRKLAEEVDARNAERERAWEDSESHERFVWEMGKALKESNISPGLVRPVSFYRGK